MEGLAVLLTALLGAPALHAFIGLTEIVCLIVLLKNLSQMLILTKDLHVWHNVEHPKIPGMKAWMSDPQVSQEMKRIADNSEKQSDSLIKLLTVATQEYRRRNGGA